MRDPTLIKLLGLLGFVLYIATAMLMFYYVVYPRVLPIIIKQMESTLSSEGISISESELIGVANSALTVVLAAMPISVFVGWLIISAILMGLLRAFGQRISYVNTWLTTGNYFYLGLINIAITVSTPLLDYEVNMVAIHRNIITNPPLLALNMAFAVIGSLLLAYIFNKTYQLNTTKSFIASLIALLILTVISAFTV